MQIRFQKGTDGPSTMRCLRDDGTETWTTLKSITPHHDLTHYAVETTLGFRGAFYGLIAQGWNIDDFTTRLADGSFRAMPEEAMHAESLVILLQGEYASGREQEELVGLAGLSCSAHDVAAPEVSPAQLAAVRSRLQECCGQWNHLMPGDTLELPFPATSAG